MKSKKNIYIKRKWRDVYKAKIKREELEDK